MSSWEDKQSVTRTVRTEFEALLSSKDSTIQDLQEKLTDEHLELYNRVSRLKKN